jgi:hypothetical protein
MPKKIADKKVLLPRLPIPFDEAVADILKVKPPQKNISALCPYDSAHVRRLPGSMTPQKNGTRKCGKCGHTDMPGNPDYVCRCHHCRRREHHGTKRQSVFLGFRTLARGSALALARPGTDKSIVYRYESADRIAQLVSQGKRSS